MTNFSAQVAASLDDGWSYGATWPGYGTNDLSGTYGLMGGGTTYFCAFGCRFTVNIPKNATIQSANLSVLCHENVSAATDVTIFTDPVDDAAAFSTSSSTTSGSPGYRSRSADSVQWNIGTASWVAGTWYDSPSVSALLQTRVDGAGWASGQHVAFLLLNTSQSMPAGYNRRKLRCYDYSGNASGPKLEVSYTVGGKAAIFHAHFQVQGIV